jgi:hypothetical protein
VELLRDVIEDHRVATTVIARPRRAGRSGLYRVRLAKVCWRTRGIGRSGAYGATRREWVSHSLIRLASAQSSS